MPSKYIINSQKLTFDICTGQQVVNKLQYHHLVKRQALLVDYSYKMNPLFTRNTDPL